MKHDSLAEQLRGLFMPNMPKSIAPTAPVSNAPVNASAPDTRAFKA